MHVITALLLSPRRTTVTSSPRCDPKFCVYRIIFMPASALNLDAIVIKLPPPNFKLQAGPLAESPAREQRDQLRAATNFVTAFSVQRHTVVSFSGLRTVMSSFAHIQINRLHLKHPSTRTYHHQSHRKHYATLS